MYLQNKYADWYWCLVQKAQNRVLPCETYVERHHIIPRSLGGKDDKNNIVVLTAREHLIAHRLLTKMTEGMAKKKMWYAVWWLTNRATDSSRRLTAKTYASLRQVIADQVKLQNTNPPDHIRIKMKEGAKSRPPVSTKTKNLLRQASLGHPVDQQTRMKISAGNKGKKRSIKTIDAMKLRATNPNPDTREKMRLAKLGKKRGFWWTNGNENLASFTQPGPNWKRGRTSKKKGKIRRVV
jgi:hypothetical protein